MQSKNTVNKLWVGGLLLVLAVLMMNCNKSITHEGKVVFTQVPNSEVKAENLNSIDSKYASAMKITLARMSNNLEDIEVLTNDFYSARAPEVSYDGKRMVFSGQQEKGATWQIWTMNLKEKTLFQVTESRTNCTDPTWLPAGGIAFSKLITDDNALKYHALFTIGADGCCEQRITFQPHEDINASVLHDGRIIVASKQVYPEEGQFKYLVLRPDGTKAEIFHLADQNVKQLGKVEEDGNGKVLFAEASIMTSVKFNRPLHSKDVILNQNQGTINSISQMGDEHLLVSIKIPNELTFGIGIMNSKNPTEVNFYFNDAQYHIVDATIVRERTVPKKLPTTVNPEINSGYFISMNTDASDIEAAGKTAKVQVLGMKEILGEAPVEEDGSFYLEVEPDRPIRFQTINEKGEVLRGPSSWMWVRPNERRGCVGCHQDREISPGNVVPLAVEKAPFAMTR